MRLKPEEIKKLTQHSGALMFKDPTVVLKTPKTKILEVLESVLSRHFEEERQIEMEADRLYSERAGSMEKHERGKALLMIKKQIAKEKEFVLSGAPDGRFSQDKISHMAHLVADKLYDDDLCDFKDEDEGARFFKKVFLDYFHRENEVREKVIKKIQSLSNAPFEGSRDWDVLFRKYFEEEMRRLDHI